MSAETSEKAKKICKTCGGDRKKRKLEAEKKRLAERRGRRGTLNIKQQEPKKEKGPCILHRNNSRTEYDVVWKKFNFIINNYPTIGITNKYARNTQRLICTTIESTKCPRCISHFKQYCITNNLGVALQKGQVALEEWFEAYKVAVASQKPIENVTEPKQLLLSPMCTGRFACLATFVQGILILDLKTLTDLEIAESFPTELKMLGTLFLKKIRAEQEVVEQEENLQ